MFYGEDKEIITVCVSFRPSYHSSPFYATPPSFPSPYSSTHISPYSFFSCPCSSLLWRHVPIFAMTVAGPLKRLSKFLLGKAVSFFGKGSDRGKVSVLTEYRWLGNAVKQLCTWMNGNIPDHTVRWVVVGSETGLVANIEMAVGSFVTSGAAEVTRKVSKQDNPSVGRYLKPGLPALQQEWRSAWVPNKRE